MEWVLCFIFLFVFVDFVKCVDQFMRIVTDYKYSVSRWSGFFWLVFFFLTKCFMLLWILCELMCNVCGCNILFMSMQMFRRRDLYTWQFMVVCTFSTTYPSHTQSHQNCGQSWWPHVQNEGVKSLKTKLSWFIELLGLFSFVHLFIKTMDQNRRPCQARYRHYLLHRHIYWYLWLTAHSSRTRSRISSSRVFLMSIFVWSSMIRLQQVTRCALFCSQFGSIIVNNICWIMSRISQFMCRHVNS